MKHSDKENVSHEDRYQALFENSADAILIIKGNTFLDCNQACVDMLGCEDKQAVLDTQPWQLSPEFQPDGARSIEKQRRMLDIALERGSHRFEWDHKRANGEIFPVEVVLTVLPDGDVPYMHTTWHDISERKKLENELRHAQKMDAIGKLAGGVAHDFNNQLVPILGYAELLKAKLAGSPDLVEMVESIEKAGERSAELVKRLMVFSHKDAEKPTAVDHNAVLAELLDMLGQLIGEDVRLDFEQTDQPLIMEIGAGDVEQIVMNLATNARDALPEGGRMGLSVDRVEKPDGAYAQIVMEDEGCGMDAATLDLIFEPFFTTKSLGSGTGLGLSSVYSLVKQAKGTINADSAPGKGTRFEVLLPLTQQTLPSTGEPSGRTSSRQDRAPATSSGHRILVVEDDEQAANLVCRVLRDAGYDVAWVNDGIKALEALGVSEFELILTDVILPKMSGPMMVQEKEAQGMATPVLFMSGYTDDRLAAHDFDMREISLLRKPFTPSQLLRQVREKLEPLAD